MQCPKCKVEGDSNFYRSTLTRSGHYRLCKKCHKEKIAVYRQTPKSKEYQSKYQKLYRAKNKESLSVQTKSYTNGLKETVYKNYGDACACCGESESKFLTIDHTNNDGKDHRAEKGYRIHGSTLFRYIINNKK